MFQQDRPPSSNIGVRYVKQGGGFQTYDEGLAERRWVHGGHRGEPG
jgi:hypothetical protein